MFTQQMMTTHSTITSTTVSLFNNSADNLAHTHGRHLCKLIYVKVICCLHY